MVTVKGFSTRFCWFDEIEEWERKFPHIHMVLSEPETKGHTMTTVEKTPAQLVDEIMGGLKRVASATEATSADLDRLSELVEPGGRLNGRASRVPKPPVLAPTVTLPDGPETVLRPNGQLYHTRKLLGDLLDVEVLRRCRENNLLVLLYGPPGTGKTALIEAAFSAPDENGDHAPVYVVQGSGDTEFADFIGSYVQLPGGEFEWVDGPLLRAMEEGVPLYVDEIALIDPKALAGMYGVVDGRGEIRITANPERGVVRAKPGFYVVGACNPHAPGARLSEALVSRFVTQFEVTTDFGLARKLGVSSKVVTAAQNLDKKMTSGEVSWAPQLRELLAFKQNESVFGTKFALNNMVAVAPEMDRPVVADVLTRAFGEAVAALKL
jgi:nitric oxide reductase NorQ protein